MAIGRRALGAIVGSLGAAVVAGAVAFWPGPSCADSWRLPSKATYESCNHVFRLTVLPRQLEAQLQYFEDKVEGVEPSGQDAGGLSQARGVLERRTGEGEWSPVWDGPLVNDVSPVSALVSDSGDHVVTFDNWHSMGFGDNVVVIYGREGRLVRSLALTDILPEAYVQALPRSVSSLWWSGEHRIEGERLILKVRIPDDTGLGDGEPHYVEAVVDLATGQPRPLEGADWQAASSEGVRIGEARAVAEAARVAWMRAPLVGPANDAGEGDWHDYLREAFYRLDPEWDDNYPVIKVLRTPTAPDYAMSVEWMNEALAEARSSGSMMLGSPSQANLAEVVRRALAATPEGALDGRVVYVAVEDDLWPEFRRMFAPTGARLVQLNPSRGIPQRPERMLE